MSLFTPITTYAPANASVVNAPLYQLDAAISALGTLPATVTALQTALGNMATANTTSKITVGAINELLASLTAANALIAALQGAVGDMATANTTSKVVVGAINELKAYLDGLAVTSLSANLILWTTSEAYQMTPITYSSTYPNTVASGAVVWPDGSAGVFTTVIIDPTWEAINAYTISHVNSGRFVLQASVTRNANGNISIKPLLTVS